MNYIISHISRSYLVFNVLLNLDYSVIRAFQKCKKEELLREDIFVICVLVADVSTHNKREQKKQKQLQNKYRKNKNAFFVVVYQLLKFGFYCTSNMLINIFKDAK